MRTLLIVTTVLMTVLASALLGSAARAAQPVGSLDAASTTMAGGWAYDPDHPADGIPIHVYVDGAFHTAGFTDGVRADVNAAFGITGAHGFNVPLDIASLAAGSHEVVAYAIDLDGEGNPGIAGSPKTVTSVGPFPTGHLDLVSSGNIAGWASDPNWSGPIVVHVYVDGVLMKALLAADPRPDVGAHGFNWDPPPYGTGAHQVVVYAIGVDGSGAPDGQNPAIDGSPGTLDVGCDGLVGDELGWCQAMYPYWVNRQLDTEYVGNDTVRVGVNRSFGGTIFEIYDGDWQNDLILQHGGGAVQLSIWGYDAAGPAAWFSTDWCDPAGYPSEQACKAAGHGQCRYGCCSEGVHAVDCVSATTCPGWWAAAPWNPIQAQGAACGWNDATNDVVAAGWTGASYYTRHDKPNHFTTSQPPPPMPMEQWVTAHEGYAEVRYRLSYTGPYAWSAHPQEIPAIFTAPGMTAHYYAYAGAEPFTGDAVTHYDGPSVGLFRFPARSSYGHGDAFVGYVSEGWWSVCDASQERCLTVASFDDIMNEASMSDNGSGAGYITALGAFAVQPGMVREWTVYFFPYRYDQVVGGETVRQRIYDLAPPGFQQLCPQSCEGKQCGPDGCGGTCGGCAPNEECSGGGCECASSCETPCPVPAGDPNGDGVVNVLDVQCIILFALWDVLGAVEPPPGCLTGPPSVVDLDCNGQPDVADVQVAIRLALGMSVAASMDTDGDGCPDACQLP